MELELPDDLLIEILLLLPVKSLLRFKCVSKHWLSLIQSPSFVDRHRHISITSSTKLLCVRKDPITESHVISVLDRHTLERLEDLEWPPFLEEKGFEHIELPGFIVISAKDKGVEFPEDCIRRIKIFGPVNGIYCIHRSLVDKWVGTLTLWNPATRAYKHIHPQVSFPFSMELLGFRSYGFYHQQEAKSLHIGFGSDRSNNDFKVVVICQWEDIDTGMEQHWHLRVYNHASDTWRTVYYLNNYEDPHPLFEGAYPPFPLMLWDPPVSDGLLNGVVHWACSVMHDCVDYNQNNVLAFDMTTDSMQLMKGPPFPTHLVVVWSVWVLNETIAAVSYAVDSPLEVWVMMEYGAETSWARFYSLPGVTDWDPVGIPCDDRMFFDDQNGQLVSVGIFDEVQHVKEHDIYGMPDYVVCGSLEILNHVETLTTLKPE